MEDNELNKLRHTCEHILHLAMTDLFPGLKRAMGPATPEGFYLDFDYDGKITDADFPKIEKRMQEIIKADLPLVRQEISIEKAKEMFKDNPYKLDWVDQIEKKGEKAIIYWTGEPGKTGSDVDLCKGPHVESTGKIGAFKLLSVAGAYWHGDEKNKMLTRIYGTCFPTQKELDNYLWQQEEAKKRDHKRIGKELDLFSLHKEGPGFIFWHPNGMKMRQPLIDFWQKLHRDAGYEEVSTPIILTDELWKQSGHWQNYKDSMYFTKIDGKTYALKPMNCPGMILIYKNSPRSYRELPIRWRELGLVHRHEPSGTLNGLFRERAFRQDDAHIFCEENQIEQEIKSIINMELETYSHFKFDVEIELSTRPSKSIGSDEMWEKAENTLKKVLADLKLKHKLSEGEGAFYGPKIDFHLTDSLGRRWQCGTIQLDFAMPERFDLTYIDKEGQKKRPVMIHRAIFGSIHRFFGILIEHYGGAFPLWLSPTQVRILPISDKQLDFAKKVNKIFTSNDLRAEVDEENKTFGYKIRQSTLQKVPYMIIIGDKEMSSSDLSADKKLFASVRTRKGEDLGQVNIYEFIKDLKAKIEKYE